MASRRSRRMQRGGGTQDRLATLGAMKQLMGDPLKDLGGLLSLQKIMQDMDRGAADEARATRSEDFARRQHQDVLDHQARESQAQTRRDSANYQLQKARNDLMKANNLQQREAANREHQIALQKLEMAQEEQAALAAQRADPEMVRMWQAGQALVNAGVMPTSPAYQNWMVEMLKTMDDHNYFPSGFDVTPNSVTAPPPGSSNERDALDYTDGVD